MNPSATRTLLVAALVLAAAIPGMRISAAPAPQVKSGVDRLYVIDCGDGSGPDESRWTPGANVGTPVGFPGHCYLIHHTQGWFLWTPGLMMLWRNCPIMNWCCTNGGPAPDRSGANQSRSRLNLKRYTLSLRTSS
jgi:hypothetical protein